MSQSYEDESSEGKSKFSATVTSSGSSYSDSGDYSGSGSGYSDSSTETTTLKSSKKVQCETNGVDFGCGTGRSKVKKCPEVDGGAGITGACCVRGKDGKLYSPNGNECFKVCQMTGNGGSTGGIVGYVYTYEIRKKHRIVKKNIHPYQPYKVIVLREEECNKKSKEGPEYKIKEAEDEIKYANQQIAKALYAKKKAQERKQDAEEWRFRAEELKYEQQSKKRSRSSSRSNSRSSTSASTYKTEQRTKPMKLVPYKLPDLCPAPAACAPAPTPCHIDMDLCDPCPIFNMMKPC